MLGQRRRRWANINLTSFECLVVSGRFPPATGCGHVRTSTGLIHDVALSVKTVGWSSGATNVITDFFTCNYCFPRFVVLSLPRGNTLLTEIIVN